MSLKPKSNPTMLLPCGDDDGIPDTAMKRSAVIPRTGRVGTQTHATFTPTYIRRPSIVTIDEHRTMNDKDRHQKAVYNIVSRIRLRV
jgi:hypothetical protein